jgi:hypothetical protein
MQVIKQKLTLKEKIKVGINCIVIAAMVLACLAVWHNPKGFSDILIQGIPAMVVGIIIIAIVSKAYQRVQEIRNR